MIIPSSRATARRPASGYFHTGLPYNRLGRGPRPLVVVQGLLFENKPQPRFALGPYSFLGDDFTVYVLLRLPGMPYGYSIADMATDVATTIRQEFGGPVDVIGVSTGGSIVQHLAADHPDVVRRLVIHSSACALSPAARDLQLRVAELASERRCTEASELLVDAVVPRRGIPPRARPLIVWPVSRLLSRFGRLHEITAPTLVVAGAEDPFYSEALFRETAAGIPGARLVLYPGMGHPARGKLFARDVLAFLG